MSAPVLTFNGIDATTGRYLLPPITGAQLATRLRGGRVAQHARARGLIGDPLDLSSAGWGVIFAPGTDQRVRAALTPLIARRRGQAQARDPRRFRDLEVLPNESKSAFLARHGIGRGPVDPRRMPYYLLLVGDLDTLPMPFQAELATQHAVGRLAFETPDAYRRYAEAVLAAEDGPPTRRRAVELVGPANADDLATQMSSEHLLTPLAARLADQRLGNVRLHGAEKASRQGYLSLLNDPRRAALLFSASHCIGFPCGHPRQATDQGAILCQDWPGPRQWRRALARQHYLAADDIDHVQVDGQMLFLFGCFSAGTPRFGVFTRTGEDAATPLAPAARIAPLVKRLLCHPGGAALAVIGHIDRAWTYSFHWAEVEQLGAFEATLARLLAGHPVGHALEYFHQRCSELAVEWTVATAAADAEHRADEIHALFMAATDARHYALLGDPAVRLRFTPLAPASR